MEKFVGRCHSLDCHKVADSLQEVLDTAEEDKRILRTLHVVQELARSDIVGIEACLMSLVSTLEEFASDDNEKISSKAGKVMRELQGSAADEASVPSAGIRASVTAPQPDLLTLDEVRQEEEERQQKERARRIAVLREWKTVTRNTTSREQVREMC